MSSTWKTCQQCQKQRRQKSARLTLKKRQKLSNQTEPPLRTCSDIVRKMQYGIANGCEVTLFAADLKQIVHVVCNIQSNR
jgi:hypothetical protein